jgi:hypothetical protein
MPSFLASHENWKEVCKHMFIDKWNAYPNRTYGTASQQMDIKLEGQFPPTKQDRTPVTHF